MGVAVAITHSGDLLGTLHHYPAFRVSLDICHQHSASLRPNYQSRPESPRWLVHEGYFDYGRTSVAQTNSNGDVSDPVAIAVYKEILDALEWEKKEGRTMSPKEIVKTPTARKRFLIGMSAGPFSCIAGNIIASYYLGQELNSAGITDQLDQLKAVSRLITPVYYSRTR